MARVGYGINRRRADFARLDIDALYLDGNGTSRSERREMVGRGLRPGDTLVVLRIGDLGAGKGLRNLRAELDARGVNVEVAQPEPDDPPKPRGRPPARDMSPSEDERFRSLWADPAVDGGYIIDQACEAAGEDKADRKARERVRQRLLRRYGSRGNG